ncbi:Na+/phosphate symporter (NptA) [Commensalibacter communis]|uniref:Na+/phosphate symporter (NptA) n=1 Tax=Commensalibacter communis TaxID=2972786 RepID=A0A9W4TMZ5_9PROT|nr:Na/Pi cotransporter family protein [Commensalibacter communis]CAI3949595.1 Na+/phosphate symporter (NptA) [Commensalibacter communis]CAI3950306.1 Na+/phosphate symporter (NptA) [Commensalibacter communis]CAI3951909.1 Na+/phosphate symporter (NptA) [Commensalibacter communis]CAI3951916.1 Na+/phosphate symporter (NptA) [Commensalibacter communis]CAI3952719.1 Na+/phosphate symporter (NptA) [Commensalibacter communis]
MNFVSIIDLAGSVALLLWGVHMVQTGVQRAFGARLNQILSKTLRNKIQAFFAGLGITAVLQSSTATGLMITSFTANGVIGLPSALAVMLGANVGTTLIVQLLSFDVSRIAPLFVLIGVVMFRRWMNAVRDLGRSFIGLGLILISLHQFLEILQPYTNQPSLRLMLGSIADMPLIAVFIALVLTWIMHSSVAVVLLIASFASHNVIPPETAFAMVIGSNIGTALNPVLEGTGKDIVSKRLPIGNLLNRVIGAAICMLFLTQMTRWFIYYYPDMNRSVANFHTLFNIVTAAVFLPFLTPYAEFLKRIMPRPKEEKTEDPSKPIYLDKSALKQSPMLAISNAIRESLRLCDALEKMLYGVDNTLKSKTPQIAIEARRVDIILDKLTSSIQSYVTALDPESLNRNELTQTERILTFCTQIANASDVLDRNVLPTVHKMAKQRIILPDEMMQPLKDMLKRMHQNLRIAATLLMNEDETIARKLAEEKDIFRETENQANSIYYRRLREETTNKKNQILYGSFMLELARDLKRTNTHIVASAAYPVLDQSGLLLPSRLQPEDDTNLSTDKELSKREENEE